MPINYANLRNLTARELISALLRDGFVLRRQRGSHQLYSDPATHRRVTVPFHRGSDTLRRQTLKTIIERQARWSEEDLTRLGLLQ